MRCPSRLVIHISYRREVKDTVALHRRPIFPRPESHRPAPDRDEHDQAVPGSGKGRTAVHILSLSIDHSQRRHRAGLTAAYVAQSQASIIIFFVVEAARFFSSSEFSFILYGLSAFVMWLRTLHFILVQPELGQVRGLALTH